MAAKDARLLVVLGQLLVDFLNDEYLLGFLRQLRLTVDLLVIHDMAHHYHVLLREGPPRGHIVDHSILHVVYDLAVDLLDFPLPGHALVNR